MKRIIFTLLFMIPVLLFAQNFTNICSSGPTFFKKKNISLVKAYKTSSYTVPIAGDTIFYSFRTIRDTGATCRDTTKGSILGRKIYRNNFDGMFYFFNKYNDTIYINTKALLNTTWRFTKLTGSTYLEAKVVALGPDSVMSVMDDVMKIELTAKRSDGMTIPNAWNGKYLKLSKHYGLSETFDMVNVPYDTAKYILVGKFKPVIGIQEFGWKETYNYSLGDEFHFSGNETSLTGGPSSTYVEIRHVIEKTVYGANTDSVVYRMDRCRSTVTQPGNSRTYIHDTLYFKYKFNVLNQDSTIWRFTDQFVRQNVYASQYDRYMKAYNNRQSKKVAEDRYRFLNNCFTVPTGSVVVMRTYAEGLGQSEYYRLDSDLQKLDKLVYFKKGSEWWGSPVGTECSPLLGDSESPAVTAPGVKIIPNPMKNQAQIIIEGTDAGKVTEFTLFNIVGKKVYSTPINAGTTTLDRNNLPSGMYLYVIKGKDTVSSGKLVIE